jgi:hypothetical protein
MMTLTRLTTLTLTGFEEPEEKEENADASGDELVGYDVDWKETDIKRDR